MPLCMRMKDVFALEEQLVDEAQRCQAQAQQLPPGSERDALLKKARQANTAANMIAWVDSPGLRPPD